MAKVIAQQCRKNYPKYLAYTYNASITRSQIHKASLSTSQQCHHIFYLSFAGRNIRDLEDILKSFWLKIMLYNKYKRNYISNYSTFRPYLEPQWDFSEAWLEDPHPHDIHSQSSASSYLSNTPCSEVPGLELSEDLFWCIIIHSCMKGA